MPGQEVLAPDGTPIPSLYREVGVQHGWKPTPSQRLRLFVLGAPGHGKTTFVTSNPEALVFDFEDSTGDVQYGRADRVYTPTVPRFLEVLEIILKEQAKGKYKHIAFDTLDKFMEMTILHLTEEHNRTAPPAKALSSITEYGQAGAGWFRIRDFIMGTLAQIYGAGYGWTGTGHFIEKELKIGETITIIPRPVLAPSIVAALARETSFIATIERGTRSMTEVTGHRKVRLAGRKQEIDRTTTRTRIVPTFTLDLTATGFHKARYIDVIPDTIEVPEADGWTAFADTYLAGIERLKSGRPDLRKEGA